MFRFIKEYFRFSRNEERALILLSILLLLLFLLPPIVQSMLPDPWFCHYNFFAELPVTKDSTPHLTTTEHPVALKLDPNTASVHELQTWPIPEWLAKRIYKYHAAGGQYKTEADLKKVYGMNDSLLALLRPYLKLPPPTLKTQKVKPAEKLVAHQDQTAGLRQKTKKDTNLTSTRFPLLELNKADTTSLQKISGIGPVFAERIVKYRTRIGGFYQKEQLLDVYGISKEVYARISPQLSLDSSLITKIDLNAATFKEINQHPYISYAQTKSIVRYRDLMDHFNSPDELTKNKLMTEQNFNRVQPYLMVSQKKKTAEIK